MGDLVKYIVVVILFSIGVFLALHPEYIAMINGMRVKS